MRQGLSVGGIAFAIFLIFVVGRCWSSAFPCEVETITDACVGRLLEGATVEATFSGRIIEGRLREVVAMDDFREVSRDRPLGTVTQVNHSGSFTALFYPDLPIENLKGVRCNGTTTLRSTYIYRDHDSWKFAGIDNLECQQREYAPPPVPSGKRAAVVAEQGADLLEWCSGIGDDVLLHLNRSDSLVVLESYSKGLIQATTQELWNSRPGTTGCVRKEEISIEGEGK